MATMNPYTTERRHFPDRRSTTSSSVTSRSAKRMNAIDWIAMVLLIVGGLNWGMVGLTGIDLVAAVFGDMSMLSRAIYVLVGLSALYSIYTSSKMSRS